MEQEQIIQWAREAGCTSAGSSSFVIFNDELEAFAKLVRNDYSNKHAQLWLRRIDEAVTAERERIIAANAPEIERANAHIKALEDELASLRARGN
jgi:predicted  nucleic acid-binding Zn-ribbon protein